MSNGKWTSLWKLLTEYNFEIDIENNSDLICCICKNLLKNAHQGVCGCLYCHECIKLFLSTDEKYCPGKNSQCKEYMINIALNLQVDHVANKRIAGVIVKCPIDFCKFRDRLSDMEHHIETHSTRNMSQDFLKELGEVKKEMVSLKEEIRETQSQSQGQMNSLREELGKLRSVAEFCKEEIRKLKSSSSSRNHDDKLDMMVGGDFDEVGISLCCHGDMLNGMCQQDMDFFDYMEDDCTVDMDSWRKRKLPILDPMFPVGDIDLVPTLPPVPPVHSISGIDYRALIEAEVHRQTGDLRNTLAEQEAELRRLRDELENRLHNHGNNYMEAIDLTESETGKSVQNQVIDLS